MREVGPVGDFHQRQCCLGGSVRVLQQLAQGLYAVEGSPLVIAQDVDLTGVDGQRVGSGHGSCAGLLYLLGIDVDGQLDAFLGCLQEIQRMGEFPFLVLHVESFGARQLAFRAVGQVHHVRGRVDDDALVVYFMSRYFRDNLLL